MMRKTAWHRRSSPVTSALAAVVDGAQQQWRPSILPLRTQPRQSPSPRPGCAHACRSQHSRCCRKKDEGPAKPVILGRTGNNVKAGIVGMPNVGKSTTFNIMCNMTVPAENFPVRRHHVVRCKGIDGAIQTVTCSSPAICLANCTLNVPLAAADVALSPCRARPTAAAPSLSSAARSFAPSTLPRRVLRCLTPTLRSSSRSTSPSPRCRPS